MPLQRIRHPDPSGQRLELDHRLAANPVPLLVFADDVSGRVVVGDVLHFPERYGAIVVVLADVVVHWLREVRVGRVGPARFVQVLGDATREELRRLTRFSI